MLTITSPIDLASTTVRCWQCGRDAPVWALVVTSLLDEDYEVAFSDEGLLLKYIKHFPSALLENIHAAGRRAETRHSKTLGDAYLANTCMCGALIGDDGLHREPSEGFFPTDAVAASRIRLRRLSTPAPVRVDAEYVQGPGDLILRYATREP